MTKIDWEKYRKKIDKRPIIDSKKEKKVLEVKKSKENILSLLDDGIWPVGKHKGTKIKHLSEKYLIWAGLNLEYKNLTLKSALRQAANNELLRRYHSGEIKL